MESFKNYMTLITAFILTATLITAAIPDCATKSTVKFVISAMLMCIILSPLTKSEDFDINLYTDEYTINNEVDEIYGEYAAEKVRDAVVKSVADFAEKKNIKICDTEVETQSGKIKSIITDKNLAAYTDEISSILGVPREYIKTAE